MSKDTTPLEEFRRVTAATMRAMGRQDVNVTFVPDGGTQTGNEARLTVPARELPPEEVARTRGEADSLALRTRFHDRRLHARRQPKSEAARAIFDAVEQVRVEAIGANRMSGVAANLDAVLNERCEQRGFRHITTRDEAPVADVVGMMVREQLTGRPVPEAAKAMVDLWRADIERMAGKDMTRLREVVRNQDQFSRALKRLIRDLKLSDEEGELDRDEEESDDAEDAQGQSEERGEDGADSSETHGYGASGEETDDSADDDDSSETVADQAQTDVTMGASDEEEPGRAERPWIPPGSLSNEPNALQYHP